MATLNKPVPTPDTLASPAARPANADPGMLAKRRGEFVILRWSRSTDPTPLKRFWEAASDLMRVMLHLRECLEQAWSQEGEPLDQLSQVLPCIDQLGKVSKQLESLVELRLSLQDRRLLAKEIRLQRKTKNRSIQKEALIAPGAVIATDQEGPLSRNWVPQNIPR